MLNQRSDKVELLRIAKAVATEKSAVKPDSFIAGFSPRRRSFKV